MIPRLNLYCCVSIRRSEYSRMGQAFQNRDRGSALSFKISRGNYSPANTPTDFLAEAKSKEKHGVWEPMPELTITSPYVYSSVDSNTFTMGNPMLESTLTLFQSQLYPSVRDFGFGLRFVFSYLMTTYPFSSALSFLGQ
jgi:hypothetical protein